MDLTSDEFLKTSLALKHTGIDLSKLVSLLDKAEEYRIGLLSRAPAKVGDVVMLCNTPEINEKDSWGWIPSKHFLVKGERAVVKEVSYYQGSFTFGLWFDNESWIDRDYNKHFRHENKSQYWFSEKWIVKV